MTARNVYSVGQINNYIRRMFTSDYLLRNLCVRGEVSNCKYHSSGHIYFTLKDSSGTLSCVMFASRVAGGLSFRMKEGDQVVVEGSVDVWTRGGSYQLYANRIWPEGAGLLNERYEQLKKKLEEMGMFDEQYKQPIPRYIRRLGVVTAPTGAAVRDIINIATRRNPYVQIILYPAIVQGDQAKDSIIRGIRMLDHLGDTDPAQKVDVIIIGRGGGSLEDLWAFNEEAVAQAVFDAGTPIISAVGHETDTVITDYVADLRAPTPSAAAELAVFEEAALERDLNRGRDALYQRMTAALGLAREQAEGYRRELVRSSPAARIREWRMTLENTSERLGTSLARSAAAWRSRIDVRKELDLLMQRRISDWRQKTAVGERLSHDMENLLVARKHTMQLLAGRLEQCSPLARLSGGYGFVTTGDDRPVTDAALLQKGDPVKITLRKGRILAEVRDTVPDGNDLREAPAASE